jgi:hypothetical protein
MIKSFSSPANLNKLSGINLKENKSSFDSFEKLKLRSQQKLLSFGEYCNKPRCTKKNRLKIIKYFYKNIYKNKLLV